MSNNEVLEIFERFLRNDKKASENTLNSYMRDIRQLADYLQAETEHGLIDADEEDLDEYISSLREAGKSVATVSRSIASIKCMYQHLVIKQYLKHKRISIKKRKKQKESAFCFLLFRVLT